MKDEDSPKKNIDTNQIKIVTKHIVKILKNSFKYSQCSKKIQALREGDVEPVA